MAVAREPIAGGLGGRPSRGQHRPTTGGGGRREVDMSGRRLDDSQLALWCERMERQLGGATPLGGIISLNLSINSLGNASAATLAKSLTELAAPIRVIKLFQNAIGDPGALALAKYVEESKHALAELHLSHNVITREGAAALLTAAVAAPDRTGGPRYPSFDTVGQCRPVPLWLRLEYNNIDEGQQFQRGMESELLAIRCERGYHKGPPVPMICEAVEGCGCSSRACSLLCPGGLGGAAAGPVVHAPHLGKQGRPGTLHGGGFVARAGSRPLLALPAPGGGDDSALGALKPSAALPRARSPVRMFVGDKEPEAQEKAQDKATLPVKQCRFLDVRLGEGSQPGAGAAVRKATPEPPRQQGSSPSPAALKPEVGQVLKVTREVTADDAIKSGFQPDTYLQPLKLGDEVVALHVCEGDEAGWIWAKRVNQETGGWLSLDALAAAPTLAATGGA